MAINTTGAVEVPLSIFGGLVTEEAAINLPAGASPDCQDVVFQPGMVSSRKGMMGVFDVPLPLVGGVRPTVLYGKTYIGPKGNAQNLYFDSFGRLWKEEVESTPGTYTQLYQSMPGSRCSSVTAFGREYIAISDALHGADIPLQWDGENLDRVTQDGPGAPPTVSSFLIPGVDMAGESTSPTVLTVTEADPSGVAPDGSYFTRIRFYTPDDVSSVVVGQSVTIAGNFSADMNVTAPVTAVYPGTIGYEFGSMVEVSAYLPGSAVFGMGGTATLGSGAGTTMTRANGIVNVRTALPLPLKPGYRVQITGVPASEVGGGISSIVINNEDQPGVATITTNSAHGLVPGISVSLKGIESVAVGGGIVSITRVGGSLVVTTTSDHNLSPGAVVKISGASAALDTVGAVALCSDPKVFTVLQPGAVDVAPVAAGSVNLAWPVPQTADPTYFEVIAAPTNETFQVQVSYSNGTWSTGSVLYAWDGTFFVFAVQSDTEFSYQQYGPNATATTVGRVTPWGQASPGEHQCQVLFLTRQGYLTRPSPPAKFVAAGGQFLGVSNIPIGPSNVVARVLAFTGALGAYFYYIPVAAQVNGQVVSTGTVINDNTTDSLTVDFADTTLYAAIGINTPGNNLANEVVLDGALAFGMYASRLLSFGQRNKIENLLNMGFDGGYSVLGTTIPTGWSLSPSGAGGVLYPGRSEWGWAIVGAPGSIYQSFYADAYGGPIAQPNVKYRARAWVKGAPNLGIILTIFSESTGFSTDALLYGTEAGVFVEANFTAAMPATIPSDMKLSVRGDVGALVDEISILYRDKPYRDDLIAASYVNNPEGFDGVTGVFGSSEDSHKVMGCGIVNDTLYLLTQDPGGQLHEVNDGPSEPSGWQVRQVASNCGLLSPFALTQSQADAASASGAERWFAWASSSGARIFGGGSPDKISQEIQPDWDRINRAARLTVWALNDPDARCIYFGLPTGAATAPNLIYPMSFRGLDTSHEISAAAPIRVSYTGHLAATDNTRKWTRWNIAANGMSLMRRQDGKLTPVLLGGKKGGAGTGNVYTLDSPCLTDEDYGDVLPYYVTYFFVSPEMEAQLQLGSHRKMVCYFSMAIEGSGFVTVTPLVNRLTNAWPLTCKRQLVAEQTFDFEWDGGQAIGQRIAFKIAWSAS